MEKEITYSEYKTCERDAPKKYTMSAQTITCAADTNGDN